MDVFLEDERPAKPGLPVLLVLALVFWLGCAAAYQSACGLGCELCTMVVGMSAGVAAVSLLLCVARIVRPCAAACIALSLGCAFGMMGAALMKQTAADSVGRSGSWHLELASDCAPGAYGSSAYADACGPDGQRLKMAVQFSEDVGLLRGTVLEAQTTPKAIKAANVDLYWNQGVGCTASVVAFQVVDREGALGWALTCLERVRAQAIQQFGAHGGEAAGLLQALACGYRPTISESGAYEGYKECGLAHLVAVSGAHLAIVVFLIRWLLQVLRVPLLAATLASSAFVMAYLVLAGIPISAVRAAIMVVLSLLSPFAQRRGSALSALALCIVIFICVDPAVAVSASFVLSVGSTLGILLFASLIASWFMQAPKMVREGIGAPLSMTLASNVATLPYSVSLFSQLPLIAPWANIAATPLFTLACMSALLGALVSCAFPSIASMVVPIAALGTMPLSVCVNALASVPYACIAISASPWSMLALTVVVCVVLWMAWPNPHALSAGIAFGLGYAAIAALIALMPLSKADEVVMLDVGQGDSLLVRSRGSALLIDTGNKDSLLRDELASLGVYKLDGVVITHPDDDHCGSLASLSTYVEIANVYSSRFLLDCACKNCTGLRETASRSQGSAVQGLSVGDTLHVGIFDLTVIWPDSYSDEGGNADSLCLLCEADCDDDGACDQRALFTGDAESEQLAQLLAKDRVGDIDVLKVGHHGSKVALTPSIVDTLKPEISLISCGAHNRYGHPSDEALACVKESARILRTDVDGRATLSFRKEGIAVDTTEG